MQTLAELPKKSGRPCRCEPLEDNKATYLEYEHLDSQLIYQTAKLGNFIVETYMQAN